MEEKNAAQDERVDELDDDMKALTQQVAADRTTAATAARAVSASLADATEDLRGEIGREAKGLGERLDSAVMAWEAGAAEHTTRLDAEVRERGSAIEALGLKTETEAGRLDSEHCALKSLVGVELPRLESKIGAEIAGLTVRLEAETAQISRTIDELSLDLSTRLTNGVDSLSTQLDAADTKLSTRITGAPTTNSSMHAPNLHADVPVPLHSGEQELREQAGERDELAGLAAVERGVGPACCGQGARLAPGCRSAGVLVLAQHAHR